MKIEFSKVIDGKQIDFTVELDGINVTIETKGIKCRAELKYSNKLGWYYAVRDNNFVKAVFGKGLPRKYGHAGITHESAAEVVKIIEQRKKEAQEEANRKREEEKQRIINGEQKIKVHFHDGEYLSGWRVFDIEAELLEELGVARYVSGWGTRVEDGLVERFGEEFTYQQALEYAEPKIKAKKEKEEAKKRAIQEKFEQAKQTGQPVEIRRWTTGCNDPDEDCDLDIVIEYAMPDGSTKIVRHHTW